MEQYARILKMHGANTILANIDFTHIIYIGQNCMEKWRGYFQLGSGNMRCELYETV